MNAHQCMARLGVGVAFGLLLAVGAASALPVSGPGAGLSLWLDAGQGITTVDDAGTPRVSLWGDASGNNRDATQAQMIYRPEYVPSVVSLNGQPALYHFDGNFSGTRFMDFPAAPAKTMFYVYQAHETTNRQDNIRGTDHLSYHNIIRPTNYRVFWLNPNINGGGTLDANAHVYTYHSDSAAPLRQLRIDGTQAGSTNTAAFTDGSVTRLGWGNSGSGPEAFKGYNAEIIVYNEPLNLAQRIITENYLAAKYAIPVGAKRYVGADAAQGDYDFGVIGIGRASDGAHTFSGGSGLSLTENLDAPLAVNQYVLAGHKVATNSVIDGYPTTGQTARWDRVWYVDQTDGAGALLTFAFDTASGLTPPDPETTFSLLYSPVNDFEWSVVGGRSNLLPGDTVTFGLPLLADGYYTLGYNPIPEPSALALLALAGLLALRRRRAAR